MNILKKYQEQLSGAGPTRPKEATSERLFEGTRRLKEAPSRVGMAFTGFSLFTIVSLLIVGAFLLLLNAIPKYDLIVDARLGDDYRSKFSPLHPDPSGIPEAQKRLSKPIITDIDQDEKQLYVATLGHGVQVYDKDNMLWKTFDGKNTKGEINNDIQEVHFQKKEGEERLWTLGLDGRVSLGEIDGEKIDFNSLFAAGSWRYITKEEITAALMIKERYVIVGSLSKGAGIYDIKGHSWLDFPEISEAHIRRIIYRENRIWFLTDKGVHLYDIENHTSERLQLRYMAALVLEKENLSDLRVFSRDRAIALTKDLGCFLFEEKWSKKLLGGKVIPHLTQENIQYTAHWKDLMVVAGEALGVAAYNTVKRNWQILIPGPLPTITDFDYDDRTIAVATEDGVFVVRDKKGSPFIHLLEGNAIEHISLSDDGFLFLMHHEAPSGQEVGWIGLKKGSKQRVLIGSDTLPIQGQPQINDVVHYEESFWIATETHGVLRYRPTDRSLEQLNKTTSGIITQAKKIKTDKGTIILLANDNLYKWKPSPEPGTWVIFRERILDFERDPITADLWVRSKDDILIHLKGEGAEEKWFTGRGPKNLHLAEANSVIQDDSNGGFKAYFPDQTERKMYEYRSAKGTWSEPYDMPKHPFRLFAPQEKHLYTLTSSGSLFYDDTLLIGKGRPNDSMNRAILVRQDGGQNSNIHLFGPRRRSDYIPKKGEWVQRNPYPFLRSGEAISKFFSSNRIGRGILARTTENRFLHIDEEWKQGSEFGAAIHGDQFDEETFWHVSGGQLVGQTIESKNKTLTAKRSTYFSGVAPNLSTILEAWQDKEKDLNFITPTNWAIYSPETHSWQKKSFPQGRLLKVKRSGDSLQAITHDRVYNNITYQDLSGNSFRFPEGNFLKLDETGGTKVVTTRNNSRNRTFVRNNESWDGVTIRRSSFRGNLGAVSKIFSQKDVLWVFEASGKIGRYVNGSWRNFSVPQGFTFSAFWNGPGDHLFLIGRRQSDQVALPLYSLRNNRFRPLLSLPKKIVEARVEKNRYLWLKTRKGEVIIYDLTQPHEKGVNISSIYRSANSKIETQFIFDFTLNRQSITRLPLYEENAVWRARIQKEGVEEVHLQRFPEELRVFLRTKRAIYAFEQQNGVWSLIAEYRVFGQMKLDDAIKQIRLNNNIVDPIQFNITKLDFRLAFAKGENNPILNFLKEGVSPGRFASLNNKHFESINNPSEIDLDQVRVSIRNNRPVYLVRPKSGTQYQLPFKGGRFEIDRPFIDATLNANGHWVVLRRKSVTLYNSRTFEKVVEFGKFDAAMPSHAFIETIDGSSFIHTPDGLFMFRLSGGKANLEPYRPAPKTLYAAQTTGVRVVKDLEGVKITVKDQRFNGNAKFPFDRIREVAASPFKILLISHDRIWRFTTAQGKLLGRQSFPFASSLPTGKKSLTTCTHGKIRMKIGRRRLFNISEHFKEIDENACFKARKVAEEEAFRWYINPSGKGIFFKGNIDGAWTKVKRQTSQGRFQDDRFRWIIRFRSQVYAAHGLGISSISKDGTEKMFLTGTKVKEIKIYEGGLYALDERSQIYKNAGDNSWALVTEPSSTEVFNRYTRRYSDPFMQVEERNGKLRFSDINGRPVRWDRKRRKFTHDRVKDFIIRDGRLLVISALNNSLVSYNPSGQRDGYFLQNKLVTQLGEKGQQTLATTSSEAFQWDEQRKEWKQFDQKTVTVAEERGLRFQEALFPTDIKIYPLIGHSAIKTFWKDGRFAFDIVHDFTSAKNSWWAITRSGLLHLKDASDNKFAEMYPDLGGTSRIKYKYAHLNVEMNGQEFVLNEKTRVLEAGDAPVFTKTVFDYHAEGSDHSKWNIYEVGDRENRPAIQLNTQWRQSDPDVFYKNRFFWDQIIKTAYEPESNHYWIITPKHLAINHVEKIQGNVSALILKQFVDTKVETLPGQVLADVAFSNKTLFILFTKEDDHSEQVRKMTSSGWVAASEAEYPFWYAGVNLKLRENEWTSTKMPHTEYYAGRRSFTLEGPAHYPLFAELEFAEGYGKFSFDYMRSLYPQGDTLWAGSEGGLIKLRYLHSEDEKRLHVERVVLQEEGLHNYSVVKIKSQGVEEMTWILEKDNSTNEVVQEVQIPSWEKVEEEEKYPSTSNNRLTASGGISYLFEYDSVEDKGSLSLNWVEGDNEKSVRLIEYVPAGNLTKDLQRQGETKFAFSLSGETFEFEPVTRNADEISTSLKRIDEVLITKPSSSFLTGHSGLEWGMLGGQPAMRLPDGEILEISGLGKIKHLRVNDEGITWTRSEKLGDASYHYDPEIAKVNKLEEGVIWVAYIAPEGKGISHYLLDNSIVKKQNFFKKFFGSKNTELEEWVLRIAQKNDIRRKGKGKLDYHLKTGDTYLMPKKSLKIAKKNNESPLIIGNKRYEFENRELEYSGILRTDVGVWGFSQNYFFLFDVKGERVIVEPLPSTLPPRHLWKDDNGRMMMSFVEKDDKSNLEHKEVWQYTPFMFKDTEDIAPDEFKRVYITDSTRKLEASNNKGFIVDTGIKKSHISESSEWWFGTKINKVVKMLEDKTKDGYWIATDTSGLIWSGNPF